MIKAELISEVSARTGVSINDTKIVIEQAFGTIFKKVTSGDHVTIRGFGTFGQKHRAQKTGRNITKGTEMIIPAHNIPSFKPAAEFVKGVK